MSIVIAYATLQAISGYYNEIMTAIATVFLTLYHVGRTELGLAQLKKYRAWCAENLEFIRSARFPDDQAAIELDDEALDNSLLVNNSLLISDVPVEVDWPTRRLMPSSPGSLSVRWTGAFLCGHGEKWGSFSRATKLSLSSCVIWHTSEIVGSDGSFSLLCVRELRDKWYSAGTCSGAFDSSIVPFTPYSSCRPDVSDTEHPPGSRVRTERDCYVSS